MKKTCILFLLAITLIPAKAIAEDKITSPEPIVISGQNLLAYVSAYQQYKKDNVKGPKVTTMAVVLSSNQNSTEVTFVPMPSSTTSEGQTVFNVQLDKGGTKYIIDNATNKVISEQHRKK